MKLLFFALILGWGGRSASAEPNKDFPLIDDLSRQEPGGDRVIQLSVVVPAAPEEVWRLFTTGDGWKRFAVAFAAVDMRVGGIIETSYNPQAKAGDPDNIKNEIVAYVPGRMLAFRCVQAPRNFEHKEEFYSTATVIECLPAPNSSKGTRVVATSMGYKAGAAFDALFSRFRWGNAYTLERLRLCYDGTPPAGSGKGATK
jgi:uncharacterized protein YndB with AHSA1/START domain